MSAKQRITAEIRAMNEALAQGVWSEAMERRYHELVRQWYEDGRRWRVDYEEVE